MLPVHLDVHISLLPVCMIPHAQLSNLLDDYRKVAIPVIRVLAVPQVDWCHPGHILFLSCIYMSTYALQSLRTASLFLFSRSVIMYMALLRNLLEPHEQTINIALIDAPRPWQSAEPLGSASCISPLHFDPTLRSLEYSPQHQ